MIEHISINNFATIENTEFDLEDGLNVITGETGAGKSIVVEAISLALGSRADSSFIRHGEEKAYVELLAELDGEEYVISREISSSGKNICKLNGRLTTLSEIQEIASKIADIHGQYDNQLLLDPDNHLALIDSYGEQEIASIKDEYSYAYQEYKRVRSEYEKLLADAKENEKKKDFYEFQIDEINNAAPVSGEDQELADKISILQNHEKIYSALAKAKLYLEDQEPGLVSMLGEIKSELDTVSNCGERLKNLSDSIDSAYFDISDIAKEISDIKDMTDFSEAELDSLIKRQEDIESLKSKYGGTIQAVLEYRDKIEKALLSIDNFASDKDTLEKELEEKRSVLKERARALTEARNNVASKLSEAISSELNDLNFEESDIDIHVSPAPAITSTGADQAEILISTNKGEPLKPLIKVASGGEISRIMLAIKNAMDNVYMIPTMIFDEIDQGISGITASAVARKLRKIAASHQIVCITHLPQIAASGTTNLRIMKTSDSERTFTSVHELDEREKIEEIARLLAGEDITDTTLKSAKELAEHFD